MSKRKTRAYLAPTVTSTAVELADGRTFRKRILPLAEINYPKTKSHPGGKVKFDHAYHQSLIDAFHAGAYDGLTVQLASTGVEHNRDPRLTAGVITDVSHEQPGDTDGPGLYMTFKANSRKNAKLIKRNPTLGCSPEIIEGRTRVDGKSFPAAIHNVLATHSGRVVGLGRWRAVELSETADDITIIDLSDASEERTVAKAKGNKGKSTEQAIELSDDQLESLLDDAAGRLEEAERRVELADKAKKRGKKKSRKGNVANFGGKQAKPFGKSTVAMADEAVVRLSTDVQDMKVDLADAQWKADRLKYARRGVPKAILDLAEDVLIHPHDDDAVITLADSDGETVDVDSADVIRRILDEVAVTDSVRIDLSDDAPGTAEEPSDSVAAEIAGLEKSWTARSGPVSSDI